MSTGVMQARPDDTIMHLALVGCEVKYLCSKVKIFIFLFLFSFLLLNKVKLLYMMIFNPQ